MLTRNNMIKKYLKILTIIFRSIVHSKCDCCYETGAATEYKITVSKVELCATGSAIQLQRCFYCLTPVTVSTCWPRLSGAHW